ncbi:hypothetical protein EIK77_007772 [Talaromyces pinophilus]|jgi:F-type H+-transporting ATPase subunit c|uniref:ATP synthase subunit 9, mitochondrial n=2 Tax=Talaromyces sect. Talaromyces TaxID=2752537 RepID=A0A364KZQ8_TALAM|nr:uncharacterized protein BHQ10_005065 [Talaromyces amestolkiae]KAF3399228.1 ATP synthase subunit 9 [Talaromyces pinophilus]PCG96742.1 ATPase, F0/V0 complex, subunit C [Penicillium occitanis (nom. inval.)]KAI7968017.1 hypothetical protein EIK77_007772 [Talaromyces pinophilus]PCG97063.1 hypothetical protein PENOC_069690 [Penicillium occitanis (nom. inval.)]RAO69053.1 hypothetical protein BHQ10_005065 [Talaromyces amestolkiae]
MASKMFANRMATMASQSVARSTVRSQFAAVPKRTFTNAVRPMGQRSAFQAPKRTIPATVARQAFQAQARRGYSSEIANALVEVSQNIGMGSAAIGLAGAGTGIGLVFAALLHSVARNPSLRGQLFAYAILGFAFVEAIGLFDLMIAMMAKFL